jgi:hypothetical protein
VFGKSSVAVGDGSCVLLAKGLDAINEFHLKLVKKVFKLLFAPVNFWVGQDGVIKVGAGALQIRINFLGLFRFVPGVDVE